MTKKPQGQPSINLVEEVEEGCVSVDVCVCQLSAGDSTAVRGISTALFTHTAVIHP